MSGIICSPAVKCLPNLRVTSCEPSSSDGEEQPEDMAIVDRTGQGCVACRARKYAFDRARSYAHKGRLNHAIAMLKFQRIEPSLTDSLRASPLWLCSLDSEPMVVRVLVTARNRAGARIQPGRTDRPPARKAFEASSTGPLLARTKPRPNKHIRSLSGHWESVSGAFATRPGSQVDNIRVLLVDDVVTTGATLDACAKALTEAGAKSVIGLTIARAARHPM
jgi:predicted amidophosphoribosyltransferase